MIQVVVDDLAFVEVDAVLRPANQSLDPVSVAASRLDEMAGRSFVDQRRLSGSLEVGSAVVTQGGELSSPYIIHVVIKGDEINADRHTVERALQSAWHRATEWQLARVATPLVGSGPGQLTVEAAADLLKQTLGDRPQADYPAEVQVVVDREDDKALIARILEGS